MIKYLIVFNLYFFCFSFFARAEDFLEILKSYYFPAEVFITLEKEKELSEEFLNKIYLREFTIKALKFEGIEKIKGKEFQKPFNFCSRLLYLWHNCGLKVWKENEDNSLKFSDAFSIAAGSPILCEGFKEHFCYYNQQAKNPLKLNLKEKLNVLHFSKKIDLCEAAPIYCYSLDLNFYLIDDLKNFLPEQVKEIKILVYRLKEIVPFKNKRILEIYGKIIE